MNARLQLFPEWEPDTLGQFALLVPGKTPSKGEYSSSGDIKMIKFRDVMESGRVDFSNDDGGWLDSSKVDRSDLVDLVPDTILLTNAAHSSSHLGKKIGFVEALPEGVRACFVGELTSIRAKAPEDNGRWLFYLLQTPQLRREIIKAAEGAHLVPFWLKRIPFRKPPPEVRNRVAEKMKAVDDFISSIEEHIRKAERVAVALDQAHFAAGPNHVRFPYEYGMTRTIPHGWASKRLGKIADITSGITLNQDREAADNGVRYLTVVNVYRGRIDLTEVRYLESRGNEAESKRLNRNDILVVEGHANPEEIGRAALVTEREAGMSFQNHLFRVRLENEDEVRARFLVRALNSPRVRRHWVATANTSSGLSTINRTALRRLIVPLPEPREQDWIIERLDAAEAQVAALKQQLAATRRLKTALLQNLLIERNRVTL